MGAAECSSACGGTPAPQVKFATPDDDEAAFPSCIHVRCPSACGGAAPPTTDRTNIKGAVSLSRRHTSRHAEGASPTRSISRSATQVGAFLIADSDAERLRQRLFTAARMGDFKASVDAVADGCEVHFFGSRDLTPLMLSAAALGQGALPTLRFLLNALAEVEAQDERGWTALLHASRNGRAESVDLLLQQRASVHTCAADGKTALILAVLEGADGLVGTLVSQRADIDACDNHGWTALLHACAAGNYGIVGALLRSKADAHGEAEDGTTGLMVAAGGGYKKLTQKLLYRKADVNAIVIECSTTALMKALDSGEEVIAEMLIEWGAEILAQNSSGQDAIDIAEKRGLIALKGKLERRSAHEREENSKLKSELALRMRREEDDDDWGASGDA